MSRATTSSTPSSDAAAASIAGATCHRADIPDVDASEQVIATIEEADGRIDVLFINAGVGGFAPLAAITEAEFSRGIVGIGRVVALGDEPVGALSVAIPKVRMDEAVQTRVMALLTRTGGMLELG